MVCIVLVLAHGNRNCNKNKQGKYSPHYAFGVCVCVHYTGAGCEGVWRWGLHLAVSLIEIDVNLAQMVDSI